MFERYGEFDTVEMLNEEAERRKEAGDEEGLKALAAENGIDAEDAEDYMDGCTIMLASPLMAAVGKLKLEAEDLKIEGILEDWKNQVLELCMQDTAMQKAVRTKRKSLKECMARLIRFAFENKAQVSDKIVNITKVTHNGKEEAMRKPLYLGVPNKAQAEKIIKEYYLA